MSRDGSEPITTLGDLASILRSKNAGPYVITCDVIFANLEVFNRVHDSESVTADSVAMAYRIPIKDVVGVYFYRPALALKVSFINAVHSGDVFSRDVAGSSQHIPLAHLPIRSRPAV